MTANMSNPATYFHKESLCIICDSFHAKMTELSTDAPQIIVASGNGVLSWNGKKKPKKPQKKTKNKTTKKTPHFWGNHQERIRCSGKIYCG